MVDSGTMSGAQEVVLEQVKKDQEIEIGRNTALGTTLINKLYTCNLSSNPSESFLSLLEQLRNLSLLLSVDLGLMTGDQASMVLAVTLEPRPVNAAHLEARYEGDKGQFTQCLDLLGSSYDMFVSSRFSGDLMMTYLVSFTDLTCQGTHAPSCRAVVCDHAGCVQRKNFAGAGGQGVL